MADVWHCTDKTIQAAALAISQPLGQVWMGTNSVVGFLAVVIKWLLNTQVATAQSQEELRDSIVSIYSKSPSVTDDDGRQLMDFCIGSLCMLTSGSFLHTRARWTAVSITSPHGISGVLSKIFGDFWHLAVICLALTTKDLKCFPPQIITGQISHPRNDLHKKPAEPSVPEIRPKPAEPSVPEISPKPAEEQPSTERTGTPEAEF